MCIIICEFAGVIGSIFTMPSIGNWYKDLEKPFFNPPNWIFAPVWTLLFLLMGTAFYLVWQEKWVIKNSIEILNNIKNYSWIKKFLDRISTKEGVILIFFVQLFLNILWSFIFFGLHRTGFAFLELLVLWVAILLTIISFYRISKKAAYMLYPYIFWVSFAGVLNFMLWFLN